MYERDVLKYHRARGTMYGVACGDALGAPVEFWPHAKVKQLPAGLWRRLDGNCTDDTGMSLALARGLLRGGPARLEECVGKEFIGWLATGPRGVGFTCHTAIDWARKLLDRGVPTALAWRQAALFTQRAAGMPSEGNGALMRCAFVGLYAHSIEEAEDLAIRQARLTHIGPDNLAACAWYAGTLWIVSRAKHRRRAWHRRLRVLPPQFRPLPAVADPAGTAVDTLRAVVYVVNRSKSFTEALTSAVLLGGDTDTVAALVGGLAGAMCGSTVIPLSWQSALSKSIRMALDTVILGLFRG